MTRKDRKVTIEIITALLFLLLIGIWLSTRSKKFWKKNKINDETTAYILLMG